MVGGDVGVPGGLPMSRPKPLTDEEWSLAAVCAAKDLMRTPEEWAEGLCLVSNAGCHPNHPYGQCKVCESRLALGLPQDPDGTIRNQDRDR